MPASIGKPIPGVQVKIGDRDALLVKGPNLMLGYWGLPEATKAMFTEDGWLNTGDIARIDAAGMCITGRLKDIIVLSNGEKMPPGDMEEAILGGRCSSRSWFGEGRSYLSALVVVNPVRWAGVRRARSGSGLARSGGPRERSSWYSSASTRDQGIPGLCEIRRVVVMPAPWTSRTAFSRRR